MKKLRRHEINRVRKGVKFVSDKVTEISYQCSLGKLSRLDADKKVDRVARNIVAKFGLNIALNIAGYFKAMIEKNAPNGTLTDKGKKVEIIKTPFFEYFERFNAPLPVFIFQSDKKEVKIKTGDKGRKNG